MSKVEPWQGHRKPPDQLSGSEGCGPGVNLSPGEQPRWVQMPTTTRKSFLIERQSLRAYSGVVEKLVRLDSGSANSASIFGSSVSCSGVRCTIQTGLPRQATVSFSPGAMPLMSTSTGAPAARARSEGSKLLTKGTATNPAPTAPAHPEAMSQVRLAPSIFLSLMKALERDARSQPRILADASGRTALDRTARPTLDFAFAPEILRPGFRRTTNGIAGGVQGIRGQGQRRRPRGRRHHRRGVCKDRRLGGQGSDHAGPRPPHPRPPLRHLLHRPRAAAAGLFGTDDLPSIDQGRRAAVRVRQLPNRF